MYCLAPESGPILTSQNWLLKRGNFTVFVLFFCVSCVQLVSIKAHLPQSPLVIQSLCALLDAN